MIQVNQSEVREAQQQRADLGKTRTNRSEQEEKK